MNRFPCDLHTILLGIQRRYNRKKTDYIEKYIFHNCFVKTFFLNKLAGLLSLNRTAAFLLFFFCFVSGKIRGLYRHRGRSRSRARWSEDSSAIVTCNLLELMIGLDRGTFTRFDATKKKKKKKKKNKTKNSNSYNKQKTMPSSEM